MSHIDIHARHTMDREQAQHAADQLSKDLASKFGIDYAWEEDIIHFERPGVHGQIIVNGEEIHIQAQLGFMLALLKGPIENEIHQYLSEHFGCEF